MKERVPGEGASVTSKRWFRPLTLWLTMFCVLGLEGLIIPATGITEASVVWKTLAKVVAVVAVLSPVYILAPWIKAGSSRKDT